MSTPLPPTIRHTTIKVMAIIIAVLLGTVAALAAGIIAAAVGKDIAVALSWGSGSFIATTPLVLIIEQALGLL